MNLYIKGLVIGFSIAAPVGPIGLLCIRRTLTHGRMSGLVSGLGAATADGCYGMVAAFGLTAVSSVLVGQKLILGIVGGLFLCYLGIRIFMSRPADQAAKAEHKGLAVDYISTLFLTLTNPMTILSFAAIFAGLGLVDAPQSRLSAAVMVGGVFSGSALWWLLLSSSVGLLSSKTTERSQSVINKVSGAIIFGFGVMSLVQRFFQE